MAHLQHDGLYVPQPRERHLRGRRRTRRPSTGYTGGLPGPGSATTGAVYEKKKLVMLRAMSSEINTLGTLPQPHLRKEPPHPRLHAQQPHGCHRRDHRLLPRVQDLHQQPGDRRPRPPAHRIRGRQGQGHEPHDQRIRLRFPRKTCCSCSGRPAWMRREEGMARIRDEVPADHRAGHGEGPRGYGLLRVQQADLPQRGGGKSRTGSARRSKSSTSIT